jgi:RNA polymerase sigma-70 factor, ECF subfamily
MAADDARQTGGERLASWVREHARPLRGYVLGMVRRADVADDIVQEVFQRAWQARDHYRDEGHERAYLLRIADRLVVDRSRRQGHEVNVDDATWQELEPVARPEPPLEVLASNETGEELTAALGQLTPPQKRVLLLRYFGNLTFEEIASTLECPLGTALSHARRGLIALRKLIMARMS